MTTDEIVTDVERALRLHRNRVIHLTAANIAELLARVKRCLRALGEKEGDRALRERLMAARDRLEELGNAKANH